jgi:hypothetical protein
MTKDAYRHPDPQPSFHFADTDPAFNSNADVRKIVQIYTDPDPQPCLLQKFSTRFHGLPNSLPAIV